MILDHPLTKEQRQASQRNINYFNAINGLSYMCLGETIMILLAVKLKSPDYVVAILGGMLYFGFLLLPLGKVATAHIGGARSQAAFWVARNLAALIVASSSVWHHFGFHGLAAGMMVFGSFMFYGFRAAGVVMSQPLIGDITLEDERARVIATNGGVFYAACFLSLIIISTVMRYNESIGMLTAIILVGAVLGIASSRFINRVDETEAIRASARRPIVSALRESLRSVALRRLLLCGFANNLAIIMVLPISVLIIKKGYGVSDTGTLLYSLVQFAASAAMSFAVGRIGQKIGPRKTLIYAYAVMIMLAVAWTLVPDPANRLVVPLCFCLFMLAGACRISIDNSVVHYFLQTVEAEHRVASSILLSMTTGVGAGVVGMAVSGVLLYFLQDRADVTGGGAGMLSVYRLYFAITVAILLPGLIGVTRLEPLPLEKRRIRRSWWHG